MNFTMAEWLKSPVSQSQTFCSKVTLIVETSGEELTFDFQCTSMS